MHDASLVPLGSTSLGTYSQAAAKSRSEAPARALRGKPRPRAAVADDDDDSVAAPPRFVVDAETGALIPLQSCTAVEAAVREASHAHLRVLHNDAAAAVRLASLRFEAERELQDAVRLADEHERASAAAIAREGFAWRRARMAREAMRERVMVHDALEELKREQEVRLLAAAKREGLLR